MNFFLVTDSEHIVLQQKTGEYSAKFVCQFTAANALAAIVACEALNNSAIASTAVTQECYENSLEQHSVAQPVVAAYRSCTHCDNEVQPGVGLCHQCYMAMQPM